MLVIPVMTTIVNWNNLLQNINRCLGRSLTAHLDSAGMRLDGLPPIIAALGGIRQEGDKPQTILNDPGPLLKHINIGFLIVLKANTLMSLLEDGDLVITSGETISDGIRASIVTGTLEQWRTTIINCCSRESSSELRAILDQVILHFEKMGLAQLWYEYQKRSLPDSTFYLEPKT